MKNTSALLFGFVVSIVGLHIGSPSFAAAPGCGDLFAKTGTQSRPFTIQVRNENDRGNRLVDVRFETAAVNRDKQLRLKTTDGTILDVIEINKITRNYGEITSVQKSDYWYATNMLTNVAVASRRNFSIRWHGDWLLKNEFFVIQTVGGVHFFEVQGAGVFAHYQSIKADANAQIKKLTVNMRIESVRGIIGTTPVQVIEVTDSQGRRYYSGLYRNMIPLKDIDSVEVAGFNP